MTNSLKLNLTSCAALPLSAVDSCPVRALPASLFFAAAGGGGASAAAGGGGSTARQVEALHAQEKPSVSLTGLGSICKPLGLSSLSNSSTASAPLNAPLTQERPAPVKALKVIPLDPSSFSSMQTRQFPPRGAQFSLQLKKYEGIPLFSDEEIIEKLPITKAVIIQDSSEQTDQYDFDDVSYSLQVSYSANNRAIILQQAARSCVPTSCAMLLTDLEAPIDIRKIFETDLSNFDKVLQDLPAGIYGNLSFCSTLAEMKTQLDTNGSALVEIHDSALGGHCIVVDEICFTTNQVRLRDPYHGWEITISTDSFLKIWSSSPILQLSRIDSSLEPRQCLSIKDLVSLNPRNMKSPEDLLRSIQQNEESPLIHIYSKKNITSFAELSELVQKRGSLITPITSPENRLSIFNNVCIIEINDKNEVHYINELKETIVESVEEFTNRLTFPSCTYFT